VPAAGNHANGSSTPAFQGLATNNGAMSTATYVGTNCTNTYCHNPAGTGGTLDPANTGTGVIAGWTNAAYIADGTLKTQANCGMCHKSPGDASFTSAQTHTPSIAQDCAGCHGHNGDSAGSSGQRHIDGIKYGGGACDTCHGYPPMTQAQFDTKGGTFVNGKVEDQGGGGYHTAHLLTTVVSADGFTPCLPCHPSGYHNQGGGTVVRANVNVNDAADAGYRFDSSRSKRYNMTSRSCSNVSCHFKPTLAW